MSSGSYRQAHVNCPFYRSDDGRGKIICEGILDGSTLALRMKSKADFELQIREYCAKRYICCEIYRMLMDSKYEEESI